MLIDQLPAAQPAPVVPVSHPRGTTELSPRLYNRDLAPTKKEGRRWSGYNIFTLWANDVHSLGNYAFAIGLFALGPRRVADPARASGSAPSCCSCC